jgi:hypothetical protein
MGWQPATRARGSLLPAGRRDQAEEVHTLADIDVQTAISEFRSTWGDTAVPFFRGQREASWSLAPGIFRGPFKRIAEQGTYYEFVANASGILGVSINPWDVLFTMQHHGLPTRLLDWTEVFGVALHFAVREPFQNAAVWMLDPYMMNNLACKQEEILDVEHDFKNNYFEYFIAGHRRVRFPAGVVAIYPRRTNTRIAGQRCLFTLHASRVKIESKFSKCIQKFELPSNCRNSALQFLSLAGINDYSVFPDLDGLCRYLRGRFEYLSR